MTHLTDEAIVERFWQRDETAIAETEKRYGKYLFSIAQNILGSAEDSRECVNDSLFRLWQSIPPERPGCLKAYLSRIARNLAINREKERSRQKRVPSEYIASLDELSEFLESGTSVDAALDDKRLRECLERFIDALGKRRRYIFVARFYCGYKVAAIAELLGVKERAIFKELSKMKKDLKEQMIKEGCIDVEEQTGKGDR